MPKKYVYVNDMKCWHCHKQMKFAMFCVNNWRFGTYHFSEKDCIAARERGAIIYLVHGDTSGRKSLKSVCVHCGAHSGNSYIPLFINDLPTEENNEVPSGYYCSDCKHHFE